MKAIKNFFSRFKWHEYLLVGCFYAVIITLGIVFQANAMIIISALLSVTAVYLISKGMILGNIISLVQIVLYSIMSYMNGYYGEIIVCGLSMIITIFTFVSWFKNRSKDSFTVKVGKRVSWTEVAILVLCVGALFPGIYFMLKAFNTENLIVSAISVATTLCAGYLAIRRSSKNFIFYLINNTMCFTLWFMVVIGGVLSYITTLFNVVVLFYLNCMGLVNWAKLRKAQIKSGEIVNSVQKETDKEE